MDSALSLGLWFILPFLHNLILSRIPSSCLFFSTCLRSCRKSSHTWWLLSSDKGGSRKLLKLPIPEGGFTVQPGTRAFHQRPREYQGGCFLSYPRRRFYSRAPSSLANTQRWEDSLGRRWVRRTSLVSKAASVSFICSIVGLLSVALAF